MSFEAVPPFDFFIAIWELITNIKFWGLLVVVRICYGLVCKLFNFISFLIDKNNSEHDKDELEKCKCCDLYGCEKMNDTKEKTGYDKVQSGLKKIKESNRWGRGYATRS